MTLIQFVRLMVKNIRYLVAIPMVAGISVFILTMNQARSYSSSATIYTGIASGQSIDDQNGRIDHNATNNAFDNLLNIISSRTTTEEVCLRLFTHNLLHMDKKSSDMLEDTRLELTKIVPPDVKALADTNNFEKTLLALKNYHNKSRDNFVYELLHLYHKHYSINAVSKVNVKRLSNSDLIELSYLSDDPGIAKNTLAILIDVFTQKYASLKMNQSDAVVKYFENQLLMSSDELHLAEDRLLQFNKENKIINYYEETKHIASQKEKFELTLQQVEMDYNAAQAVLSTLEARLSGNEKMQLNSQRLIATRNELAKVTEEITLASLANESQEPGDIDVLKKKSDQLKQQLRLAVDTLSFLEGTREGINMSTIAGKWLLNVISFEENRARREVLYDKRKEFDITYAQYAPLGANIKRIEREIDVEEREYLSLLHSLALAKLKQQNLEFATNLKILDDPIYPLDSLPSKRKSLVLLAMIAGFMLTAGTITGLAFFDNSLKSPLQAAELTGMKLAGYFPDFGNPVKNIEYDKLLAITRLNLLNYISLLRTDQDNEEFKIALLSLTDSAGKSYIKNIIEGKHELLNKEETDKLKKLTIDELPDLKTNVISNNVLHSADLCLLVANARHSCSVSDRRYIETLKNSLGNVPFELVLNKIKPDNLDEVIGEVPKKRSSIRRIIKSVLSLKK